MIPRTDGSAEQNQSDLLNSSDPETAPKEAFDPRN
jgi:hypothetical protein